jgi:hypothetical protein
MSVKVSCEHMRWNVSAKYLYFDVRSQFFNARRVTYILHGYAFFWIKIFFVNYLVYIFMAIYILIGIHVHITMRVFWTIHQHTASQPQTAQTKQALSNYGRTLLINSGASRGCSGPISFKWLRLSPVHHVSAEEQTHGHR